MKKAIFIIIAIVMTVATVTGCAQEAKYTGPVEKITLAAYAGETAALVYVAEEQGFFEENGC